MSQDEKVRLINSVKPMLTSVAKKLLYKFAPPDLREDRDLRDDLIQQGTLGVLQAIPRFKKERNTKFSSFAYFYIYGAMKAHIAAVLGVCKMPHNNIDMNLYPVVSESEYLEDKIFSYENVSTEFMLDLEVALNSLYPMEKNAIMLHSGMTTEDKYPETMPFRKLILKNSQKKLKKILTWE